MKKLLSLSLAVLTMLHVAYGDQQPPYSVKDPAIQADFENIYLQADKLSLFTASTSSGVNTLCIDSPTFCVDAVLHAVGFGTSTPIDAVHIASGNLYIGPNGSNNTLSTSFIKFSNDTTNPRFAAIKSQRGADAAHADLRFFTMQGDTEGSAQRMMIDSAGNMAVGGGHNPVKRLDVRGASEGLFLLAPTDDLNTGNDIFQITNAALSNVFNISKAGGFVARSGSSQITASGESKFIIEADAASQSATLQLNTHNATTGQCTIYMGDGSSATKGKVNYDPSTNKYTVDTNGTTALTIDSSQHATIGAGASVADPLALNGATSSTVRGQLSLYDTTAMAAAVGGLISFGGQYIASTYTEWGSIQGVKANATSSNADARLVLRSRSNASGVLPALTLDEAQDMWTAIGGSNSTKIAYLKFPTDSAASRWAGISSFRGGDAANIDLRFYTMAGDSGGILERVRLTNAGNFDPQTAGTYSSGNATTYWNDISYKTITDRGCLGWFDDGVVGFDGVRTSDLKSFNKIALHPTKKTIYGAPMLDYRTFPKIAYKRATYTVAASTAPIEFNRDENDDPYYYEVQTSTSAPPRVFYSLSDIPNKLQARAVKKLAADGIEMTSLFSIMIGAFKEADDRIAALEAKTDSQDVRIAALESAITKLTQEKPQ